MSQMDDLNFSQLEAFDEDIFEKFPVALGEDRMDTLARHIVPVQAPAPGEFESLEDAFGGLGDDPFLSGLEAFQPDSPTDTDALANVDPLMGGGWGMGGEDLLMGQSDWNGVNPMMQQSPPPPQQGYFVPTMYAAGPQPRLVPVVYGPNGTVAPVYPQGIGYPQAMNQSAVPVYYGTYPNTASPASGYTVSPGVLPRPPSLVSQSPQKQQQTVPREAPVDFSDLAVLPVTTDNSSAGVTTSSSTSTINTVSASRKPVVSPVSVTAAAGTATTVSDTIDVTTKPAATATTVNVTTSAPISVKKSATGTASLSAKDAKEAKEREKASNRGNYRCGRCGQPKVNHVCAFADAISVCAAGTQASTSEIVSPFAPQTFSNGERVLSVSVGASGRTKRPLSPPKDLQQQEEREEPPGKFIASPTVTAAEAQLPVVKDEPVSVGAATVSSSESAVSSASVSPMHRPISAVESVDGTGSVVTRLSHVAVNPIHHQGSYDSCSAASVTDSEAGTPHPDSTNVIIEDPNDEPKEEFGCSSVFCGAFFCGFPL